MAKIVVDSGCVYVDKLRDERGYNIKLVPLNLQVDDEDFIDDATLDIGEYLKKMNKSKSVPKTAAPSPQAYMEAYEGDESVFVVTLSSKLSGSYNSAILAKDMYKNEVSDKFIHVFDSFSACSAETVIAIKIQELINMNTPDLEIVDQVNKFIEEMETIFILEKYDNLVKTGRMNPYVAKIASMLSMRAICKAIGGEPVLFDKARGYNKAVTKLINEISSQNRNFSDTVLAIMHVRNLEKAKIMKEEISKKIKFREIIIAEASGLCSTYGMENGIVLAY